MPDKPSPKPSPQTLDQARHFIKTCTELQKKGFSPEESLILSRQTIKNLQKINQSTRAENFSNDGYITEIHMSQDKGQVFTKFVDGETCVSEKTIPQVSPEVMENSRHVFGNSELAPNKLDAFPYSLEKGIDLFMNHIASSNMEAHSLLELLFA